MSWILHQNDILATLKQRLDAGLYSHANHPFLESSFVIPLLTSFPRDELYLLEYSENDNIVCAFVMYKSSSRVASSYVDGVSQISLTYIDASITTEKLQVLLSALFERLPGFFLALSFELQDPDLTCPSVFAGLRQAEVVECAVNTSLPAGTLFDDYWAQRAKKIRKEVARNIRAAERDYTKVEYKVADSVESLDAAFADYCRLENGGWKGEQGSALTEQNVQGQFYKQVIRGFMQRQHASIHQLLFDDVVVASLIVVENESMIIVLKTTYDESCAKFSPGRVLDYYMLKETLTADNKKHVENYTNASASDQKWFPRVRNMYNATVYRSRLVKHVAQLRRKLRNA